MLKVVSLGRWRISEVGYAASLVFLAACLLGDVISVHGDVRELPAVSIAIVAVFLAWRLARRSRMGFTILHAQVAAMRVELDRAEVDQAEPLTPSLEASA